MDCVEALYSHFERTTLFFNPRSLLPDVLSADPLHSPRASEESPLLYGSADDPADRPLCLWDVSSALHEDGLPPSDDTAGTYQVRGLGSISA